MPPPFTQRIRRAAAAAMCLAGLTVGCLASPAVAGDSAAQPTKSFRAVADAHTSARAPAATAGKSRSLQVDGRPRRQAFVVFDVRDLDAGVRKATLRVFARTSGRGTLAVRGVRGAPWRESAVSHRSKPRVGAVLSRTGGNFRARRWISLDVTRAVRGSGKVALALTTRSRHEMRFASREVGRRLAPRLIVKTRGRQTPVRPPSPSSPFGAVRPYDVLSPWNTPVGANPTLDPKSSSYIAAIADNGKPLTSDPDQYAIPVYHFDEQTPRVTMKLSGYFSSYDNGDNSRVGHGFAPTISDVPVPPDALQSAGSDGQIVFWDPTSGTEYAFWQFYKDSSGVYRATNGYRYHTTSGYYGRFADGKAGRGAGLPYFGGLVRRWEIDQGRIEHALAFAYDSPSSQFVYPASKSDGAGVTGIDLPEGTRLQLDPGKTDADFEAWGLSPAAKVIARALQTYGMYVVDNSGSSKIYLEDRKTAGWEPSIDRNLVSGIPWSAFRVVEAPRPPA